MPLKITFELSDRDLRYFRRLMTQVRRNSRDVSEDALIEAARCKIDEICNYSRATQFVLERLERLALLVEMLEDLEWQMEGRERARVLEALSYFAEGEDLVPDRVPGLGFLDDAIMIELIVQDLRHQIEAYEDFREFQRARVGRANRKTRDSSRRTPLDTRRSQLHARMRRRARRDQTLAS